MALKWEKSRVAMNIDIEFRHLKASGLRQGVCEREAT